MKTLEKKDLEMRLVCSTIAVSYINNLGYFSLFSVFFLFPQGHCSLEEWTQTDLLS